MINAEVIPHLLVKGVAPNGREYDLSMIIGDWLATVTPDQQLTIFQSPAMSAAQVKAFWQWSGRRDKPPKSLRLLLQVNPEFVKWVSMRQARDFVAAKLSDAKLAEDSLMRALRNGQISSRGIVEAHDAKGPTHVSNIEFRTRDVVKWLKLEFNITVNKYDVACYPQDSTTLRILADATTQDDD
jgi:hypothetical protein